MAETACCGAPVDIVDHGPGDVLRYYCSECGDPVQVPERERELTLARVQDHAGAVSAAMTSTADLEICNGLLVVHEDGGWECSSRCQAGDGGGPALLHPVEQSCGWRQRCERPECRAAWTRVRDMSGPEFELFMEAGGFPRHRVEVKSSST